MEIPVTTIVQVKLSNGINHGYQLRVVGGRLRGSLGAHFIRGIHPSMLSVLEFLLHIPVHVGVREVDFGHKLAEQGFGTMQAAFQSLDVLGGRIPSPV